jgi:tetratricopeptide (TPR) repeat protein
MKSKFYCLTFVLISCSYTGISQKLDSLKGLLPRKTGGEKIDVLFELGREYYGNGEFTTARDYAWEGLNMSKQLNDTLRIIKTTRVFAHAIRKLEHYDSAIKIYTAIYPLSKERDPEQHRYILVGLALANFYKGVYDESLKFHFETLQLNEQRKDSTSMSATLNNIGLVYYKILDWKKAITYFSRSIALKKSTGDNFDLHLALVNLGLSYQEAEDYVNAKKYINEGLDLCKDNDCPSYVKIHGFLGLGLVHYFMKEYPQAETFFLKSYAIAKTSLDNRVMLDNLNYLTGTYLAENKILKATVFAHRADSLATVYPFYRNERILTYKRLTEVYQKKDDFEKVAHYQQSFIELKDSVYHLDFISNLLRIEAEYLAQESKAKLLAQQQVILLKEEVIKSQAQVNIISVILVAVSIILIAVLWRNFKRKQKVNELLDSRWQERSKEFNEINKGLTKILYERTLKLDHASSEIRSAVETLHRVTVLALNEVSEPIARGYLEQIEKSRHQLSQKISSIFSSSNTAFHQINMDESRL